MNLIQSGSFLAFLGVHNGLNKVGTAFQIGIVCLNDWTTDIVHVIVLVV